MQEIVPVLQRDEAGLQGPQQGDPATEDQRRPQHHVNPDRRGEFELDQGGEPDDDQPEKENDEHLRAVARILGREVEPATGAGRTYGQEAGKEAPLAAARAAAAERGPGDRNWGEMPSLAGHFVIASAAR